MRLQEWLRRKKQEETKELEKAKEIARRLQKQGSLSLHMVENPKKVLVLRERASARLGKRCYWYGGVAGGRKGP